jgi:hypothetical protein
MSDQHLGWGIVRRTTLPYLANLSDNKAHNRSASISATFTVHVFCLTLEICFPVPRIMQPIAICDDCDPAAAHA